MTEERKVVSESRELTFDEDIRDPQRLEAILDDLVERLCAGLVAQRRRGRTIGIKVRLDDFSTHTRARTLAEAVSSADRVGPVALDLLRRFSPPRPVRLLGVRVAGPRAARVRRRGSAHADRLTAPCGGWQGVARRENILPWRARSSGAPRPTRRRSATSTRASSAGQWPGDEDTPVGFRCECARLGCNQLIELTVREYEEVRSHPRRFVVVPGHELARRRDRGRDAARLRHRGEARSGRRGR